VLILAREDEQGRLSLRYLPVQNLVQDADGAIHFEHTEWREGFPLKIWEDAAPAPEGNSADRWLNAWHTDTEWLEALHRTKYSNGVVGLAEQFIGHKADALDATAQNLSRNENCCASFASASAIWSQRICFLSPTIIGTSMCAALIRAAITAFLRVSTHATLMFAGGARTGIPRGLSVEEPYDSLSFMPTLLALTGALEDDGRTPISALWQKVFVSFRDASSKKF
jgi:hypothetical protein